MPDEDELDRMTIDDIILQRAEGLLLQSILRKMQNEDGRNGMYVLRLKCVFQTIIELMYRCNFF